MDPKGSVRLFVRVWARLDRKSEGTAASERATAYGLLVELNNSIQIVCCVGFSASVGLHRLASNCGNMDVFAL